VGLIEVGTANLEPSEGLFGVFWLDHASREEIFLRSSHPLFAVDAQELGEGI
jgi:hypothetical protein